MCRSQINFCDDYRFSQVQIRRRVAARHFPRSAHDVVASASAAKFDTHLPSPERQATNATKSEMKRKR
eukprot:4144605-Pleurochrysis_carterae.AAC.2